MHGRRDGHCSCACDYACIRACLHVRENSLIRMRISLRARMRLRTSNAHVHVHVQARLCMCMCMCMCMCKYGKYACVRICGSVYGCVYVGSVSLCRCLCRCLCLVLSRKVVHVHVRTTPCARTAADADAHVRTHLLTSGTALALLIARMFAHLLACANVRASRRARAWVYPKLIPHVHGHKRIHKHDLER